MAARGAAAPAPVLVGFAAETGDAEGTVLDHARAKLARKGCDLLVVNDVSGGGVFGADDNQAVILGAAGDETKVEHGSKRDLAHVDLGPCRDGSGPDRRERTALRHESSACAAGRYPVPNSRPIQIEPSTAYSSHIKERTVDRSFVHVRVGHRRPPRQDR